VRLSNYQQDANQIWHSHNCENAPERAVLESINQVRKGINKKVIF